MTNLLVLSNEMLLESYQKSILLGLEPEFIMMLLKEMNRRGLPMDTAI